MTPRTLRSIFAATVVGLATATLIPAHAADTERGVPNLPLADPQTGAITKAEKITDKGDLEAAAKQKDAMAKAKISLLAATEQAVKANAGFRAVSIVPATEGGHPVASVTLLQNVTYKTVVETLD